MIKVSNLVKDFDGFYALSDVNLTVEQGSIYGLIGPNGAGKSTLIRHLLGIYRPTSGSILIDGRDIYENIEMKSRITYIPDDLFYFSQSSTYEMMKLYRGIYPKFNLNLYEKLRELFHDVNEKQSIRRLSKGMQKQSAFWLAISCQPDLMIFDELVDGLDPVMRRQVWSILMSNVAENKTTILVSSHNLRELEDVCDHIGILDHGKMIMERSLNELHGSIIKLQAVFADGLADELTQLDLLHSSSLGRIYTLIVRGNANDITHLVSTLSPSYMEILPLTLEEIFIYELGGIDYEVKDILF